MPRGNDTVTKVHYKGNNEDFVVMVESSSALTEWRKDSSIPLAQVVDGFKVFVTNKHGAQGILDTASKGTLETEFGTSNDDEVIKQILEKGEVQESEAASRGGSKNITKGARVEHGQGNRS